MRAAAQLHREATLVEVKFPLLQADEAARRVALDGEEAWQRAQLVRQCRFVAVDEIIMPLRRALDDDEPVQRHRIAARTGA
eukprot:gene52495-36115_t